ncbi:MAG: nickel pincer cofactor biosynthesis protein LarC [Syntrophales bacterium]|nr:nickel pincer cofactor biosynthesis protein LarC [Syntrophales bacterium]
MTEGEDRILYFDCFSGISGDMAVAALLDLGVEEGALRRQLAGLALPGFAVEISQTRRGGIRARRFVVKTVDHDHEHRNIHDIYGILDRSDLVDEVRELSKRIFRILAVAEATVHGIAVDEVHFHELGAVDSLVDIVSFSLCYHILRPTRVWASPINLGCGTVRCAHGILPVPAPAVAELARGVPVYGHAVPPRELTTPTGLALLKGICQDFGPLPAVTPEGIGYGAGAGEGELPNVLRVFWGKKTATPEEVVVLETNLDDMNPQFYGYVCDKLWAAGARDVFITPIYMKKNRPGQMLSIICDRQDAARIEEVLFRETTTTGIRIVRCERRKLARESSSLATPWGAIRVKIARGDGGLFKYQPEYDDCRAAAERSGRPLREIYAEVGRLAALRWEKRQEGG